jgi:hypothetical protein
MVSSEYFKKMATNRLKAFGIKAIGRRVGEQRNDPYELREEPVAYNSVFDP